MEACDKKPVISKGLLASLRKVRYKATGKLLEAEKKSISKLEEIKNNDTIYDSDDSVILCSPEVSPIKKRLLVPKEQNMDYLVDKIKPPIMRMKSSDVWCSRTFEQSNWDELFQSLSTETDFAKILRISTDNEDWSASSNDFTAPQIQALSERGISSVTAPKKDEIFVSCVTKSGMKWDNKDLSMRIEELTEWLNEDYKSESLIPISKTIFLDGKNSTTGKKFRKQTIAEALVGLDPSKHGLMFFIGPVDGKMKFKMNVCDLQNIDELFSERENKRNEATILNVC